MEVTPKQKVILINIKVLPLVKNFRNFIGKFNI